MQDAMTVTVTLAALFFSFAFALPLEELLFGGIFRVFFGKPHHHSGPANLAWISLRRRKSQPDGAAVKLHEDNYYL